MAPVARRSHRLGAEALLRDHLRQMSTSMRASVRTQSRSAVIGFALLAGCLAAFPLAAKTLRMASAFDPQSMDPHALALQYHSRVVSQIYESLVSRDRNFALEPALAVSWQHLEPKRWRFKLRPGVKFHDGTAFTADDVVFSIERALTKNSQRTFQLRGVQAPRKVDDPAGKIRVRRHHEQGVVRGSRGGRAAELQCEAGDLRGSQRQRHRALPAQELRIRHPHRAGRQP
ncbi:MAG: hypothetical protein E6H73_17050 [Betaproteobacteria bacterium]|nr:MAG: hypothetical protein E6H73_17050 [Betaproteobacteria bacterium]